MRAIFYIFCLICGGLFAGNLSAATVEGLYEAEVPVEDQGGALREAGLRTALEQVMVKVSGRQRIDPEVLKVLLPRATRMAQQFRYRSNPEWEAFQQAQAEAAATADATAELVEEEVEETPALPMEPPARYLLWVQFGEQLVNQALFEHGLPIWGSVRPAVLLWMMVESLEQPRYLIAGEQAPEWQALINKIADERGLPVWLPLMDIEDQMKVNYADIWGGFKEPILAASKRYMADLVVVVRLVQRDEFQWESRWTLYERGEDQAWMGADLSQQAAVSRGMHELVDRMGERYAQMLDVNQQGRVVMQVEGVNSLADYARVVAYLRSLESVSQVMVKEVVGPRLTLQLDLLGPVAGLQQVIGFGYMLSPMDVAGEGDAAGVLNYQLLP